jgi:CMP/dCMP kinase
MVLAVNRPPCVAIDGPAGAGKSTVARELARLLGFMYVDTGAMYRAITLKALESSVAPDDQDGVVRVAADSHVSLVQDRVNGGVIVLLDGRDVTRAIRSPEVTAAVSAVSAIPGIRHRMVELQREMATGGGVVMEGRDIGTVVMPCAEVKIFLQATPEERARRRVKELTSSGYTATFEQALSEVMVRDQKDSSREMSPLTKACDAIEIDSSSIDAARVIEIIAGLVDKVWKRNV